MCSHNTWDGIDELAFYENTIFLESYARSQVVESHSGSNSHQYPLLELPWARDFLDDFALIAAGPGEASNVSAACLELSQDGDSMTIRVAKNENFDSPSRQRLSQIIDIMNQVRSRDLSTTIGQDLCFDLIATGCYRRILKNVTGSKGLCDFVNQFRAGFSNLNTKVENLYRIHHSGQSGATKKSGYYSSSNEESSELATSRWAEMRQLIDGLKVNPKVEPTKRLAHLAYEVRRSSSFRAVLQRQYSYHNQLQIIERLGKIAKFFRSAVNLVQVAATPSFMRIKMATVVSVSRTINILQGHTVSDMKDRQPALSGKIDSKSEEIRRLLRRWQKYIIHAEMILLIFYEEHPDIRLATNYIGISKRSCYLCASFIHFHKVFAVEGQHQQLYCLWTLPAEIRFGSEDRSANFVRALAELHSLLERRIAEVSLPFYRPLACLKESVANFSRTTIIARARSLENDNLVAEFKEDVALAVSRPPLAKEEVDARKPSAIETSYQQKRIGLRTAQEEYNQDGDMKVSSTAPTAQSATQPEDGFPYLGQIVLPITQTRPAVSPSTEKPSSKESTTKLPQAREQRRRRRHRDTRHKDRDRPGSRRKSTRSATTLQHRPPARRKHAANKRHLKRSPRENHHHVTVGCLSVILACLKSVGRFVVLAFHDRG